MLAVVTDVGEKLGGTLVNFKRTIVEWLKRTPHYISTYKDVNAFGQVHTDVGLVLGIALRVGVPDCCRRQASASASLMRLKAGIAFCVQAKGRLRKLRQQVMVWR